MSTAHSIEATVATQAPEGREVFKKFIIRWAGDHWRDKAGHVWRLNDSTGVLSSKHGAAQLRQWRLLAGIEYKDSLETRKELDDG